MCGVGKKQIHDVSARLKNCSGIAKNTCICDINKIMNNTITVTYTLKWRLKTDHKYQWSECGKLFNVCRGKIKKKVLNGNSIGYWIGRTFVPLSKLRSELEIIPKEKLPF